jgi:capsular polysaccharide biosynthesis protein
MARLAIVALTIVLLGVAAGLAAALVLPKTYGARADILYSVGQDPQGGDPLKQDRELSTQLVYLTSRAVLGPVAQKQGREFDDLAKDVSVQVLNNSEVIEVEADGATRQSALQTLQAVVTGYMTLISQPTGVSRNLHNQLADSARRAARPGVPTAAHRGWNRRPGGPDRRRRGRRCRCPARGPVPRLRPCPASDVSDWAP